MKPTKNQNARKLNSVFLSLSCSGLLRPALSVSLTSTTIFRKIILFYLITLATHGFRAQTAAPNCFGAPLLSNSSYSTLTQYSGEGWFQFVASSSSVNLKLTNAPNDPVTNINKIEVYSGSCNSYTLVAQDSLTSLNDSILNAQAGNLQEGNKYYIKLYRQKEEKNEFSLEFSSGPLYCGFYWSFDSTGEGQPNGNQTANFPDFIAGCVVNNTNGNLPGNPIMHVCEITTCRPHIYIGHAWASPGLGNWVDQNNIIYVFSNVPNSTYSFAITNYTALVPFNITGATQYTIISVGNACLPPEITPQLTPEDLACNCSSQLIINTVPAPNCSLVTIPNPICEGSPVCFLNPNPGYPVWGYSAVFPGQIQLDNNQCLPNGLNVGTYQINYWAYTLLPNGLDDHACYCNKPFNFLVHSKPSAPAISVTPETFCSGTPVTLSANSTGAASYNWTPGNISGQSIQVNPTGNITYAVTASNNAGCTNSNQITLVPINCCINPSKRNVTLNNITLVPFNTSNAIPWTTFVGGNYSNQTVALPNTGVLTGAFSIVGALTVNAQVTFKNTNIFFSEAALVNQLQPMVVEDSYWHGCTAMWVGIISKNDLNISGSIIEDAGNAITNFAGNPHPGMNITNNIFNLNYNGITLAATNFASQGNTGPKFKLTGNVFTCRTLPPIVYSIVPGSIWVNTVAPNLNNYPISFIKGSTVMSISGQIRAVTGVNLSSVNNLQPISIGESINAQNLNASLTNYFDFLDYGVKTVNSKTFIQNAVFQNMTGSGDIACIWHQNGNSKIGDAVNGNPLFNKYLVNFKNSNIGVFAKTGGTINGKANNFNNLRRAVNIENFTNLNSTVTFETNDFVNCQTDLYSFANSTNLTLNFSFNKANGPYTSVRRHHVFINELSWATSAIYNIITNNLNGKDIGVFMQNTQNATIRDNIIINNLVSNNGSLTYNCIELNNVNNSRIVGNTLSSGFSAASSAVNLVGINSSICQNNVYACNYISNIGVCMKYSGPCPSHIWRNQLNANPSNPSKYGIWVNNSGSTGNIGYYTNNTWGRADNEFGDFNYGNGGYDTYASNNSNSPNAATIFWNGSPNTAANPSNPFWNDFLPGTNSLLYNKAVSIIPFPLPCGQFLFNSINNIQSDNQRIPPFFGNSLNFGINTAPTLFNARRGIYELLKTQALNTASLQGAASFVTANQGSTLGEFYKMDSLVATMDSSKIAVAKAQNLSLQIGSVHEQTQKSYNTLYHDYQLNGTLGTQEINSLINLASLCPFTEGSAVYQARALLSRFNSAEFVNPCEYDNLNNARSINQSSTDLSFESHTLNALVFPNPASDRLFVEPKAENCFLIIFNVLGQKVLEDKLSSINVVNIENLSNGSYLYKIVDPNGKTIKTDKLVINK